MKYIFLCNDLTVTVQTSERSIFRTVDEVLARGIEALRAMLPDRWEVEQLERPLSGDTGHDGVIAVREPGGSVSEVAVDIKLTATPRSAQDLVARLVLAQRTGTAQTVLVIAPWLSTRTRALLDQHGVAYLDLTGNTSLRLDSPAVVISTTGAQKDPAPVPRRGSATVRGDAAGRVVRFLVDTAPPHTTTAIAVGADVSLPHASRLLTALDREALVQRGRRGVVIDVDWQALLRRRAESYSVLRSNTSQGYVSPTGARQTVARLREKDPPPYLAVTGSFAAVQRAPVAAPGQLAVYVDDLQQTAGALGLLPADHGADVVLMLARDTALLERSEKVEGLWVVAPSQLALDCLTGNGRMPAEGEALLTWMAEHEARWRTPSAEGPASRGDDR